MGRHTFIAEDTLTTALAAISGTGSAVEGYVQLTPGSMAINLRAIVTMAEATDLVLNLKYADDATGTSATVLDDVVPTYVDGVRVTDRKSHTVTDDTGNFVVDFCVDPGLIPDGKFIGLEAEASNAANLVALIAIEDPTSKGA